MLEMTEIEVPEKIQRIIMCEKHELRKPDINFIGTEAISSCKHCGKIYGPVQLDPDFLYRYKLGVNYE